MEWILWAYFGCLIGLGVLTVGVLSLCQVAGQGDEMDEQYLEYLDGPVDPRD